MKLNTKNVSKKNCSLKELEIFLNNTFSKDQILHMKLMLFLSKFNWNFLLFFDEDICIGTAFYLKTKDTIFIKVFAVKDDLRSKGYGSEMLKYIQNKYNKPITLFIETIDETSSNYEQRKNRLSFYEKNGFFKLDIKAGWKIPTADILSTDENFNLKQCKKMLRFIPIKFF